METRSARRNQRVITDPGNSIQNHNTRNERIIEIKDKEITSESEWFKVTSPDRHDNHTEQYLMRFRFVQKYKADNYLMVMDNGTVCVNGTEKDERTYFEVVHIIHNDTYKFICKGGPCKEDILYMDGVNLKTRPYTMQDHKGCNPETLFLIKSIASDTAYEIFSKNGDYMLRFDSKNGQFVTPNKAKKYSQLQNQHCFAPYYTKVVTRKVSTV